MKLKASNRLLRGLLFRLKIIKLRKTWLGRKSYPLPCARGLCHELKDYLDQDIQILADFHNMMRHHSQYTGSFSYPVPASGDYPCWEGYTKEESAMQCYRNPNLHNWYGTEYSENRWKMIDEMIEMIEKHLKEQ